MFRSALDALTTCDRFQRDGVSLYLLDLGGDVTGNGIAGLFMKIAAAFAEFERDRLVERIREVKQDQRRRGLHLGGHRPFGYRVDADRRLVPDPAEQAAIGRIQELRRAGLSLRALARTVHRDCGVTVSAMTVRRGLTGWTPVAGACRWPDPAASIPRPIDPPGALGGKYRGLFRGGAPGDPGNLMPLRPVPDLRPGARPSQRNDGASYTYCRRWSTAANQHNVTSNIKLARKA